MIKFISTFLVCFAFKTCNKRVVPCKKNLCFYWLEISIIQSKNQWRLLWMNNVCWDISTFVTGIVYNTKLLVICNLNPWFMNESFVSPRLPLNHKPFFFTLVGLYSRMSFTVVMGIFVTSDNDFKLQTAFNLLFLIYYF